MIDLEVNDETIWKYQVIVFSSYLEENQTIRQSFH